MLLTVLWSPANPAYSRKAKSAVPRAPQSTSTTVLVRTRESSRGKDLTGGSARSGRFQSTPSDTKEMTRTIAAAQPKSHSGMGRSARTVSPWARTAVTARARGARSRLDHELDDLHAGVLELRLEDPLEVGRELERAVLARADVLGDVVTVHVDILRGVGP